VTKKTKIKKSSLPFHPIAYFLDVADCVLVLFLYDWAGW
jgi:hypothetical protein